jgi:hypothetical protein
MMFSQGDLHATQLLSDYMSGSSLSARSLQLTLREAATRLSEGLGTHDSMVDEQIFTLPSTLHKIASGA